MKRNFTFLQQTKSAKVLFGLSWIFNFFLHFFFNQHGKNEQKILEGLHFKMMMIITWARQGCHDIQSNDNQQKNIEQENTQEQQNLTK
jgi:hypothetical protein